MADDLPDLGTRSDAAASAPRDRRRCNYHDAVERTKRELIVRAFERADADHAEASRLLGVHANYLHRLIRNLNLKAQLKRGAGER